MDCALTLSFSPSTIVRKNASTRLRVRVASKKPARIAETVPPVTVTSSHGKRNRNTRHGDAPRISSMRNPSASKNSALTGAAERCRSSLSPASKISSEKIRIYDPDDAALFVHHGKRKKFVQHEKFACVEYGGGRGNSHDARHHDPAQRCFQRRRQQTTGGNYANEPFLLVNRVKVNDAFAHAFASDALERFAYRHVRIQQRKILARMFDNRRVEIRDARSDIHLATR